MTKPERQDPQGEQEGGQGKTEIVDQSDPEDWTKRGLNLFTNFQRCSLLAGINFSKWSCMLNFGKACALEVSQVLHELSLVVQWKGASHFYPMAIFKTNWPLSTFKAPRMVYFIPNSRWPKYRMCVLIPDNKFYNQLVQYPIDRSAIKGHIGADDGTKHFWSSVFTTTVLSAHGIIENRQISSKMVQVHYFRPPQSSVYHEKCCAALIKEFGARFQVF